MRYIKNVMLKKPMLALTLAMLALLILGPASAVKMSGGYYETQVTPGQHISHEVNISIDKDSDPTNFTANIVEIYMPSEGFYKGLTPGQDTNPYSARPYLRVSSSIVTVTSDKPGTFLIEGDIPSDVGEGGRYAMIHINSSPQFETGVGSIMAINAPIILTIKGTKQIQTGNIINLIANGPVSAQQLNVTLDFLNTGNYHYKALAEVDLKDESGNILASASTPLGEASIIPATTRQFKLSLKPESELKPAAYIINASVNLADGTVLATKETSIAIKS